jgi:hypothetical protein
MSVSTSSESDTSIDSEPEKSSPRRRVIIIEGKISNYLMSVKYF